MHAAVHFEELALQLSNLLWWVLSLFVRRSDAFLCATPLIKKYNLEPPEDPETRVHKGSPQIELLRGEGGRSIWGDAPEKLNEAVGSHLPEEK